MEDFRSILGTLQVNASALRMNACALEKQAAALETYASALQKALDVITLGQPVLSYDNAKTGSPDNESAVRTILALSPDYLSSGEFEPSSGEQKEADKQESGSGSHAENVAVLSAGERLSGQAGGQSGQRSAQSGQRRRTTDVGLRNDMAAIWDGCKGMNVSGTNKVKLGNCEPILFRAATEQGLDPLELFTLAVARFKRDPNVRAKRLGIGTFLSQFEQWCWPDTKAPNGRGPSEVSTTFDESQNPEWAR